MNIKNYKNSPPTTPVLMSKKEKNSNFAVFEIANNLYNFQHTDQLQKKLATHKAPRNTPNYPYLLQLYQKILISPFLRSPIILLMEYNFQHTDQLQKIGNPQSTVEHPLICFKHTKKILISPFSRSSITLLSEYNVKHTAQLQKNWKRSKHRETPPNFPYLL